MSSNLPPSCKSEAVSIDCLSVGSYGTYMTQMQLTSLGVLLEDIDRGNTTVILE